MPATTAARADRAITSQASRRRSGHAAPNGTMTTAFGQLPYSPPVTNGAATHQLARHGEGRPRKPGGVILRAVALRDCAALLRGKAA